MRLGGKLFIKIFFGFWLVTIAVLGSWMVLDDWFQSMPAEEQLERDRPPRDHPRRFVLRLMYDLQHAPEEELPKLLEDARERHHMEIYLLTPDGEELLGREAPGRIKKLADRLEGARRRAVDHDHGELLLAHDIYRREQGPLRAVLQIKRPGRVVGWLGASPWLRLAFAVLVSGLICYLLSRLMTRRLKNLQQAARELANGDLDTRIRVRESGGDETDELARDFNSMAEQLQGRIQAQRRLLSDVSHELRSPLARLRIALALAQENREQSADYLARIEQEAERLEELIGQLLSSQAEELAMDSHIDLLPLLQELCRNANFEGGPAGKTVAFESELEEAIIESSGELLQRSFENLLRNALTHTPEHSVVRMILSESDGSYRVQVIDQGPGVPEADLSKIFDEFYRVDTARTRESGGYGLGLAIARRAIERHGGHIEAANTETGLAVTVHLPRPD